MTDPLAFIPALDEWRARYRAGDLSVAEHRELYETIARDYPDQNYYYLPFARDFLSLHRPAHVVELGGWDGALARDIMAGAPWIRSWTNYEIAHVPQVCTAPGYRCVIPDGWAWEKPLVGDAFVASHSLEHLTDDHFRALVAAVDCDIAYVDVPLGDESTDWEGTTTTHALTLTIDEFDRVWTDAGWKIVGTYRRRGDVPSNVRGLVR